MPCGILPLNNQCILNTRPAHQQDGLKSLLEAEGAQVIGFPAIEIIECETTDFLLSLNENIEHYHIAVFVSRNAVDGAFRFLEAKALATNLKLGVIGDGSRRALADYVNDLDARLIQAQPYNSEGLLATTELQQVKGKNILIFRGQQGRNLLGDELRKRGATVSYCEVYRRKVPDYDADCFALLTRQRFPTIAIFTSNEGMNNILNLTCGRMRQKLLDIPWLLISERMRESAVNLGHNAATIIASIADDEGILQTINEWTRERAV
jgi:uroporphyrinogen-III synthase